MLAENIQFRGELIDLPREKKVEFFINDLNRQGYLIDSVHNGVKKEDIGYKEGNLIIPAINPDRPFVILSGTFEDKPVIVKGLLDPQQEYRHNNEAGILRNPKLLLRSIPREYRNQIVIPALLQEGILGNTKFVTMEYLQGEPIGDIHELNENALSEDQVKALAHLSLAYQKTNIEELQATAPNIWLDPDINHINDPMGLIRNWFSCNKENFLKVFSEKTFNLLMEKLNTTDLSSVKNERALLVNGDLHPGNMVKLPDARIGVFDFEQAALTKSHAADSALLFVVLSKYPKLQETYYMELAKANLHNPLFETFLRLEVVYTRGSGIMGHWAAKRDEAKTPEEWSICNEHVEALKGLVERFM